MVKRNWRKRKFLIKKKNTYKLLFLLILGMTLGFAAITTTLKFTGTVNVAKTTWDIHWENPTKVGGVTATKDAALKEDDNTIVEYQVNLEDPGDYYEFTVKAVNSGTIDAMVTGVSNKVYDTNNVEQNLSFIDFKVTYGDGVAIGNNHILESGKSETYKVKVSYKTGLAADQYPAAESTYKFVFQVMYVQADENAQKVRPDWTLPTGKTKDNLEVGDEICLYADPTQCFNFIRYDNEDVVMLAKYNLNVGSNAKGEATNKQDSDVLGWVSSSSGKTKYGNVAFSGTNYWYDGSSLKPEYGTSYPADVYDPVNYKTEPDFSTTCDNSTNCYYTPGYSVAYYVEAYKDILSSYGVTIKDTRLLTYAEATDSSIGCDSSNDSCPTNGFITNTSFWLGSAYNYGYVWYVYSGGDFSNSSFGSVGTFGVRPVIVISKSDI